MATYNYSGVHAAAQDENSAALLSAGGARTGATAAHSQNGDGAEYLYYPGARDAGGAAYQYHYFGAPTTEGQDEHGAAAERGKGNVHFFELPRVPDFAAGRGEMLPFPTQTTAPAVEPPTAGYYNSGLVAGEALPLTSMVSGGKMTSAPAVAVGQDKVAGAFPERLRRGLPVLGLSVASLAVAGLAAGEPTPAAGFGLFLMLIVGLSAVTIRALMP